MKIKWILITLILSLIVGFTTVSLTSCAVGAQVGPVGAGAGVG